MVSLIPFIFSSIALFSRAALGISTLMTFFRVLHSFNLFNPVPIGKGGGQ